jgi:hypothetical protein
MRQSPHRFGFIVFDVADTSQQNKRGAAAVASFPHAKHIPGLCALPAYSLDNLSRWSVSCLICSMCSFVSSHLFLFFGGDFLRDGIVRFDFLIFLICGGSIIQISQKMKCPQCACEIILKRARVRRRFKRATLFTADTEPSNWNGIEKICLLNKQIKKFDREMKIFYMQTPVLCSSHSVQQWDCDDDEWTTVTEGQDVYELKVCAAIEEKMDSHHQDFFCHSIHKLNSLRQDCKRVTRRWILSNIPDEVLDGYVTNNGMAHVLVNCFGQDTYNDSAGYDASVFGWETIESRAENYKLISSLK